MVVLAITQITNIHHFDQTIGEMKTGKAGESLEKFQQLKRTAYAELLASLEELTETQKPGSKEDKERFNQAATRMNIALATIDVIAPVPISLKAETIEDYASIKRGVGKREEYLNQLTNLMRGDLGIDGCIEESHIRGSDRES